MDNLTETVFKFKYVLTFKTCHTLTDDRCLNFQLFLKVQHIFSNRLFAILLVLLLLLLLLNRRRRRVKHNVSLVKTYNSKRC